MGRNDTTKDATSEERINRRRSTTHDADEDVQEPKGQAKAKGRDLDTKAGNAKQDAKDVAHDLKSKAKEKGREGVDAAQGWAGTAMDKAHHAKEVLSEQAVHARDKAHHAKEVISEQAIHARDVFMDKTRNMRTGARDVAGDAKDVLRRSAHGAHVVANKVFHPSLTAKTGFVLLAATIAIIALLMGARTVTKRRHLSTFERAKEAVFGRPSMVEEAKDMASDAFKTVKGATTDKVLDAAHYAKVKGENAVRKGLEIGEDAADIAGDVLDASRKVASKLATNAYEYVKEKADDTKDAAGEAIHKLAKDARV
jgi:hypothetical protein